MFTICLDAGHGGYDPGATTGSIFEKDINLKLALEMRALLSANKEINVVLTREIDKDMYLARRCVIANTSKADYFISLHCNSAENSDAKGWEIFILNTGGRAEKLAKAIEYSVINSLPVTNRGIRTANFEVLRDTAMPAILIESGFLSNPEDLTALKLDGYIDTLAQIYTIGILTFLGLIKPMLSIPETNYPRYADFADVPEWGQPTIKKLIDKGFLFGPGDAIIDLSDDMVRTFVILDRAGNFN